MANGRPIKGTTVKHRERLGFLLFWAWVSVTSLPGCGTSTSVEGPPPDPTVSQLRSLAAAYQAATTKLGRPPKNLDELKPYLKEHGNPDELLRSSRDGQLFEVVWGVDIANAPMGAKVVVAYEQGGSLGKRWIVTQSDVTEVTNEEFAQLNVPKPAPKK
jgi:hypothetical protein